MVLFLHSVAITVILKETSSWQGLQMSVQINGTTLQNSRYDPSSENTYLPDLYCLYCSCSGPAFFPLILPR